MNPDFPADYTPRTFDQGLAVGLTVEPTRLAGQELTISPASGLVHGPTGYGKTRFTHVAIAGLGRCTDTLTWLIDRSPWLAAAWTRSHLTGASPNSPVDWIATRTTDILNLLLTAGSLTTSRTAGEYDPATDPKIALIVHSFPHTADLQMAEEFRRLLHQIACHGPDVGVHLLYVTMTHRDRNVSDAVLQPGLDIMFGHERLDFTIPVLPTGQARVRMYAPEWATRNNVPDRPRHLRTPIVDTLVEVYNLNEQRIYDLTATYDIPKPTLSVPRRDHTYTARWDTPSVRDLRDHMAPVD